ncbi:MAG: glycerate kinase [Clostridia bacterium]|nr:glycerate kinase [Clostridia bacterium]
MNVLVAGDSFKGSLTSKEFTYITASVLQENGINAKALPLSDGGEGALEVLTDILGGEIIEIPVLNGILRETSAKIGKSGNTYIIESAQAVGLPELGDNKDILASSSYGVGQMISYALDHLANKIYLTIGGTSCNDGGAGMLCALNVKFYNENNNEFIPQAKNLSDTSKIDFSSIHSQLKNCEIIVLSDVTNPLLGKNGATYVYGPQKGGDEITIPVIEDNIKHFANIISNVTGQDHRNNLGAGAGGGIGFSAMYLNNVKFLNGADEILKLADFDKYLEWADLVITGEGKFDNQSFMGKICGRIITASKDKKVGIICGISSLTDDASKYNLTFINEIGRGKTDPIGQAKKHLTDEVQSLAKRIYEMRIIK